MNISKIYNSIHLRREDLVRYQGCDDSETIEGYDARLRENAWVLDFLRRHLQQAVEAGVKDEQVDCDYCGVSIYPYCPRCGKKHTA